MAITEPAGRPAAYYPGLLTAGATLVFAVLAMLVEQAGAPRRYAYAFTAAMIVVGVVIPALQARTMSPAQWIVAGRRTGLAAAALALAASLIAGWTLMTLGGEFFAGAALGPAWIAGPTLGLALAAFLIAPYLRKSGAATPARLLALRFGDRGGRVSLGVAGIAASLLLVWANLKFAGAVAAALWGLDIVVATCAVALLCAIAIVPGGSAGAIRVNGLAFAFLASAYLAPLVWLSLTLARFPLPQLAFGRGALVHVESLEAELAGLDIPDFGERVAGLTASGAGPVAAACFAVFLAAGLAAMPLVLGQFTAMRRVSQIRPGAAWAIVAVAAVLTAAPALAAFASFGLYNNLLGMPVGEIAAGAEWLTGWGSAAALTVPGSLVTLCGKTVADVAAAVAACGGDPAFVLGPPDLQFAPEATTLAFAGIVGLPTIAGALVGAAGLAASLAGANAALVAAAVSVARDLGPDRPASTRTLFLCRLVVVAALAAAALLALRLPAGAITLALWAVAISGAVLLPVIVAAIWWGAMSRMGALAGTLAGSAVLAALALLTLLGADFLPGSGDELGRLVPGLAALPAPFHAAVLALPATVAGIVAGSLLRKRPAEERAEDRRLLASIRQPVGASPVRDPEY